MTKKGKSRYNMSVLDRTLAMFELPGANAGGLNMTELARALGVPMNSVYRGTMTLLDRGYLDRDEKAKAFRLSLKLLSFGSVAISEANLAEITLDAMRDLRL